MTRLVCKHWSWYGISAAADYMNFTYILSIILSQCGARGLSMAVTANGKAYAAFGFNTGKV